MQSYVLSTDILYTDTQYAMYRVSHQREFYILAEIEATHLLILTNSTAGLVGFGPPTAIHTHTARRLLQQTLLGLDH